MTTRASKEASRLAKHNTPENAAKTTKELVDQDLPNSPTLQLVKFKTITVDKKSAEQIKEIYQLELESKTG